MALATATTALLTGLAPQPAQAQKISGNIANLYYGETDRVTAIEPVINVNFLYEGEKVWSNKLVLDTLTGASHNGAVMSRNPQTFTTPSGHSDYTIGAGQVTLDPTFKDTRIALASSWSQPFAEDWEFSAGFNGSHEYDFLSLAVNSTVSRYLDRKNTKLSMGFSFEQDAINPVGGAPQGLSTMNAKVVNGSTDNKHVIDLLFGATQVMSRHWILQFNYNLGMSSGYMNDPYKFTSEVLAPTDPNAGDPNGTYYYDKRPDKRIKNAIFVDSKYHFGIYGISGMSYRYFFDDWGIRSHTIEWNHRYFISSHWYIEPGVRYYTQSAADFYRYFHVQGDVLPQYMSADYRLGKMVALTYGLEVGKKFGSSGEEISFRAQLYTQSGDSHPGSAYGNLTAQDLYPKLTAVIGQVIYKF